MFSKLDWRKKRDREKEKEKYRKMYVCNVGNRYFF